PLHPHAPNRPPRPPLRRGPPPRPLPHPHPRPPRAAPDHPRRQPPLQRLHPLGAPLGSPPNPTATRAAARWGGPSALKSGSTVEALGFLPHGRQSASMIAAAPPPAERLSPA